jgi:energy-coupling factor transporter transmembrane protein EcfT
MKVYPSKNAANIASIVVVLIAVLILVIAIIYFREYWHFLFIFSTLFLLFSLVLPEAMSSFYSIEDGFLIKTFKNHSHNPWKTYKLDSNGIRDYNESIFSIKLTEIIKIEKRKNLFGNTFISVYYSENNAIDIYLKEKEIEAFIKEISEKRDPSV